MGKYRSLLANLEMGSGFFHRLSKEAGFSVTFFSSKIDLGTFLMLIGEYKKWYPDAGKVLAWLGNFLLFYEVSHLEQRWTYKMLLYYNLTPFICEKDSCKMTISFSSYYS